MRKVDIRYTLLLDYYGSLLPKKQYDIANLYYNDDLSLSEIADELGITRQGVRDGLERAENSLRSYDEALALVEKNRIITEAVKNIKSLANSLSGKIDGEIIAEIEKSCDTITLKG